jgi:ATP-dependent helicase/nuclease subunit A
MSASHLHEKNAGGATARGEFTEADKIIYAAGLSGADFGTIAHSCIEAAFSGKELEIPARLRSRLRGQAWETVRAEAERMRDRFMSSALGQMARAATFRQCEFPIVYYDETDGKKRVVNGVVDLFFEHDNKLIIVDYKTDMDEDPAIHAEQLEVYRRALGAIYGKDTEARLFYLRTGNTHAFSLA